MKNAEFPMMPLLQSFLSYLQYERNRSLNTLESYSRDLEAFCKFCRETDAGLTWQTVDADVVRDWMESMMNHGNKATSINRRLSALHTFYRFALSRGEVSVDPVRVVTGPKKEKPLPQFLREDEMDRLLDVQMWTEEYNDLRTRTIILMFYVTGMRLSELVGLDDSSVDVGMSQIKVTGKRNKQRIIPYGKELADAIAAYRQKRDSEVGRDCDALFVTDDGRRMTPSRVRNDVKKQLSRVTTLKKRTPHVLRHTFATAMLNNEAGLEGVKKILGHESLNTTEIYTHTVFDQLKKVYGKAHPRGNEE